MSKKQPLENAGKIIERFGGIRPMAAKTDTPVTTVQGWKKRDVIPGTRRTEILNAASEHNIDISDLAESSISNENLSADEKTKTVKTKKKTPPKSSETMTHSYVPSVSSKALGEKTEEGSEKLSAHDRLVSELEKNNRKTVATSAWVTAGLILLVIAVGFFLLGPDLKENQEKLDAQTQQLVTLENQVEEVTENKEKFLGASFPEGLQDKIDGLQNQARNIAVTVDQLSERAKEVSVEALGDNAEAIAERLQQLEEKVEDLSGPDGTFAALVARIRNLEDSVPGQTQIENSANQLRSIPGDVDNNDLADAQQNNQESALSQTLEGVSGSNLKAGAILIAFSQFRSTLEREEPFEKDLALLQKLIGDDDPELQEELTRLSKHADGGILTASGLSSELKKLAADVVVSSLTGEDVSIKEKAKARFGDIVQIEKDGEIISGTETQATVSKAQKYMEEGKIEDSIAALENLDGPAAETVSPFINKAKGTLLAEKVKAMLNENILSKAQGQYMNGANIDIKRVKENIEEAVPFLGGPEIITDEESGMSILPRSSNGFKGFSPGE